MPIHPHKCGHCGHEYDVLTLSVHAAPDPTCGRCHRAGERNGFGVPGVKTDAFRPDAGPLDGGQFDRHTRDFYTAGVDTAGKRYMHSLAAYPGDPRAWVSDMAEAKRVVRERGWACPDLGIKGADVPEVKPVPVADDLVFAEVSHMAETGQIAPVMKGKEFRKVVEETRDRITPKFGRKWAAAKPRKPKARKAVVK